MSNPDSFIDEVNEEVRRDKLFAVFRRYGWIGISVVILLVGGAAFSEWQKAKERDAAEKAGNAIQTAMTQDSAEARAAALAEADVTGEASAVVAMLRSNELYEAGDVDGAAAALEALATDAATPENYRQMARLKLVILRGADMPVSERRAILEPMSAAGQVFAMLASEQLALIDLEEGNTQAAIDRLNAIVASAEATAGLRQRVSQLIVALGAEDAL
jgi:hypothetical protein